MRHIGFKPLSFVLAVIGVLALGGRPGAQGRPVVPPPGSLERRAIMDTLRGPVEVRLHLPVVFRVQDPMHDFHVQDGWAFIQAQIRQSNGAPLGPDFFRRQVREGRLDSSDLVMALLRRRGTHWHLVTYALCPTDVAWEGWDRAYHAPSGIFPHYARRDR